MAGTKYRLTKEKTISIGKGCLIAGLGAALTYLSAEVMKIDFGEYTAIVVALYSVLVNVIRKFIGE